MASSGLALTSYDGNQFINFSTSNGLTDNRIQNIARVEINHEEEGRLSELWFSTRWGGISRYNGSEFIPFTQDEGLLGDQTGGGLTTTNDGSIWISCFGGFSKYNVQSIVPINGDFSDILEHYKTSEFSPNAFLGELVSNAFGGIWICSYAGGLSYYDGSTFTNYTVSDGLPDNNVNSIFLRADSTLWAGTTSGIAYYDGKKFTQLSSDNREFDITVVRKIYRSNDGIIWLGTDDGIVLYTDGVWSALDTRDGLVGNYVRDIYADTDDSFWFATDAGVSHFQRPRTKSGLGVRIISVQTDNLYTDLKLLPPVIVGHRVTLTYRAIDLKTNSTKRQYRVRLLNENKSPEIDWRVTSSNNLDHIFKKPGDYTFEVIAIDRDLVYSEPDLLKLTVVPVWYFNMWIVLPIGLILLTLVFFSALNGIRFYHQRRESERLELETQQLQTQMLEQERETRLALEAELADANQMQMALLPESAPEVQRLQVAGSNIAAKEVGGDFFDYLDIEGKLSVAVGDVSGKGLKGAMNAVMASGILRLSHKKESDISLVMSEINSSLCDSIEQDMNVTMVLAQFDLQQNQMTLVNAGQHAYPLLKRATSVEPVKAKGLALGMIPSVPYKARTLELQSGDLLLFMTDGITEPRNAEGLMYEESGRFHQVIAELSDDLTAEEVVESIIQDVIDYMVDEEERDDDITLVAVKVT